ncbi:MAG TPA: 50S ribosomal protein L18e [Nitrososphaerales archaeon]|nr:50S ribosomal protein L18e [Nitrososphaerales archaeon]
MKENQFRLKLGYDLRKQSRTSKHAIWKTASEEILARRKHRPEVNVGVISRNSKEGSRVLVPGKVLGIGKIDHKVTVGAYSYSQEAKTKIKSAGGDCLSIREFMASTSSVKDVLLLG